MQRILEPELMEDFEQVKAYAEADFAEPHNDFIGRLQTVFANPAFDGAVLDLGCGPGDVTKRFASAFPLCRIDAVDGSKPMLDYAINAINAQIKQRINFIHGRLPDVSLLNRYGVIYSNSLLHHLPDPAVLWQTIKKHAQSGAVVVVMDLLRPESQEAAKNMVNTYATNEPDILQRDFYNSLLAAFTINEIKEQLDAAGMPLMASQISDRHVFISGTL
ncbi:MAG: class I SAM-dependent methyltransferase [Gammaproteobacteria bacterium]|nr:class I SAM-dependent methyltransferase [Gammaproteobacteria bacterium]